VGYHDSIVKGGSNAHDARNEVSGSYGHMFATVAHFSPPPAVSPSLFQRGYVDASRIQSEAATRKPFGNNLRFQTAIVGTALTVPQLFQTGLFADLEQFCNRWSAGFLRERLYERDTTATAAADATVTTAAAEVT